MFFFEKNHMSPMIALNIVLVFNAPIFLAGDLNYTISDPAFLPADQQVAAADIARADMLADRERESFNYATAPSPEMVSKFANASQKYQVPVDALMAIAQRDSGFNPFVKSTGPGPKMRGIINMSEAEVAALGGNPYNADTSIDHAAGKLRGFLDAGMSMDDAIKALYAGPNRAKWGTDVDKYLADIADRAKTIADRFFPAPKPTVVAAVPSTAPAAVPPSRAPEARKESPTLSGGTGFFVAVDGGLVTNAHVVDACVSISVKTDNGLVGAARVVAKDNINDLALLRTTITPKAVARIRIGARLGEGVAAFGYPHVDLLSSAGNFTLGNITALSGIGDDSREVQISAPVQSGNSGGPLLDMGGNVIGVVASKLDALKIAARDGDMPQNVNFAIKSSLLASFLDANRVSYASSGAATKPLDPADLAEQAKSISAFVLCTQR